MENNKFRILSIDGGGIRGVIPATILASLEAEMRAQNPGFKLYEQFDLICGTSTGGIIALGIALGINADEILNIYMNHGGEIFPWWRRNIIAKFLSLIPFIGQPFYSRKKLTELLKKEFSNKRLSNCLTNICIPVYNASLGQIHVFKTPHTEGLTNDLHIPAVDVALATSAAPAYFSSYSFTYTMPDARKKSYTNLIDGGMLANNPTLIGLTEAVSRLNIPIENIEILSLGTGKNDYVNRKHLSNPLRWALGTNLYELMSSAQSIYINNTVNCLTNNFQGSKKPKCKYVRIEVALQSKPINLDKAHTKALKQLNEIGSNLYQNKNNIIKEFIK